MSTSKEELANLGIDPDAGILKTMIMNHMSGREPDDHWLDLYQSTLAEASKIHREAMLLHEHDHFERAYFLAMQSLEELSKALMAADVYTGWCNEEDYRKMQNDHKKKIARVKWIQHKGQKFPIVTSKGKITKDFDFRKKLRSTYVELEKNSDKVLKPSDAISEDDASNLINAVMAGLTAVVEKTMVDGEQIGTKGFMK